MSTGELPPGEGRCVGGGKGCMSSKSAGYWLCFRGGRGKPRALFAFLDTKNVVIMRARLRPPGREDLPAGSRPRVRASISRFRRCPVPACSYGCIWCVVRGLACVTYNIGFALVRLSQCIPVRGSLKTWASVEFWALVGGGAWGGT